MDDTTNFLRLQHSEEALLNYLETGDASSLPAHGWQGKVGSFRLYYDAFWGKIIQTPMTSVLAPLKIVLGEASLAGLLRGYYQHYPPRQEHLLRCLDHFPAFLADALEEGDPLRDICQLSLQIFRLSEGLDPVQPRGDMDPDRLFLTRSSSIVRFETAAISFYQRLATAEHDEKMFVRDVAETGLMAKSYSGGILLQVIPKAIMPLVEGLAEGASLAQALQLLPSADAPIPELVSGFTQSFRNAFELTGSPRQ